MVLDPSERGDMGQTPAAKISEPDRRIQDHSLPERWLRGTKDRGHQRWVGKPDVHGHTGGASVRTRSESDKLRGPVIERSPQYCEIYPQDLNQVPTVKTREKSPGASRRRRGKGAIMKNVRAF